MNLIRLVDYFPPFEKIRYGLGPTFYYLSKEQAKLGVNVWVICKRHIGEKKYEEMEGVHIHRVIEPYNASALYQLMKLSGRLKVDVVHAHATSCPSYAMFRTFFRDKLLGTKYVVHVHGTTKGVMSACRKFIPDILDGVKLKNHVERGLSDLRKRIMWGRADALMTVSKFLAEELEYLYNIPREKVHVVYNGVDLHTFYRRESRGLVLKRHGLNQDSYVILYVGGFRPVKGPVNLIKALERVRGELESVKVLFVGNPEHPLESAFAKPIMDLIKHLKLWDMTCLIKHIPYSQMPEYFSAADALVVPSIYDSFPKVVLEAMACETPVIASSVGGITEFVQNSETGILVEPENPEELAKAIIKIASNRDLGRKLGLKARQLVEKQFTWAHAAKRIMVVYQQLLGVED